MTYKHILLIDDDEDDQEIFLVALGKVDKAVRCTPMDDAREALEMLKTTKISPDLIFLDLNLPVMNGQQFLSEIKKVETLWSIPVFILSTSSHLVTIELTKELGAEAFYTKPGNFQDLISIIRSVLNT